VKAAYDSLCKEGRLLCQFIIYMSVKTVLRQSNLKFRPEKTGIISVSLTLSCSILKSLLRFNLMCYVSWWRWMVSDSNKFVLVRGVWEISRLLTTVNTEGMLESSSFCALLPPIGFWWKHHVDYIKIGYQGANLQLVQKSMQLPKYLLILKGLIWIFLGGPTTLYMALSFILGCPPHIL